MRTVKKLCTQGVLVSARTPLGTVRVDPKSIETYVNERVANSEDVDDEIAEDRDAARQGIPAEAIRATADLLKAAQSQNLELHKLVIQGFKASHEAQDKTIARLLERVDRTELVIAQLYDARENYFDSQLERQMLIDSHKAAGERRTQMWNLSTQYLGDLVQGMKKKWGLDEESTAKLGAAADLLKTMSPEQIEVAAMMGFFNEQQCDLIEKIVGRPIQRPAKKAPPENTTTTETGDVASTTTSPASSDDAAVPPSPPSGSV